MNLKARYAQPLVINHVAPEHFAKYKDSRHTPKCALFETHSTNNTRNGRMHRYGAL